MNATTDLDRCVTAVLKTRAKGIRRLIAIAGPPASGKSTFAEHLTDALVAAGDAAALVPMDGFHLDNRILDARGLRPRKGAPETFDADGFLHAVSRLATEEDVIMPSFDRAIDTSIAGSIAVGAGVKTAVIEGNYLCFDEAPWARLMDHWDLTVRLDVPDKVLEMRLIERWLSYGLSDDEARARAQSNDLPNARRIQARRLATDLTLETYAP